MTLDGEIDAATLACWVKRAVYATGGTVVPGGSERSSAQSTRIVRRPMRDVGFPSGFLGVGVMDCGGLSVPAEVAKVAFLLNCPKPSNVSYCNKN